MILFQLFFEYFKVGLFAIGGGLATLPFLYDISDRLGWFTHQELSNLIAVAESTPGPIGVNAATYAGFLTAGIPGALAATFGLVLPSFLVILMVARMLAQFRESPLVKRAFYGLRPASTGLVMAAGFLLCKNALLLPNIAQPLNAIRWPAVILAVLLYFAIRKWEKHPLWYLLAAAFAGLLLKL